MAWVRADFSARMQGVDFFAPDESPRFLGVDDGQLVVEVNRALDATHKARAHMDALGPQCKRRSHAAPVADTTRRNHRHIGAGANRLQQQQSGDIFRVFEAAARPAARAAGSAMTAPTAAPARTG